MASGHSDAGETLHRDGTTRNRNGQLLRMTRETTDFTDRTDVLLVCPSVVSV